MLTINKVYSYTMWSIKCVTNESKIFLLLTQSKFISYLITLLNLLSMASSWSAKRWGQTIEIQQNVTLKSCLESSYTKIQNQGFLLKFS